MKSPSRWWFAAFVVVVFLAGTSVGVIVDRVWLLRGAVARSASPTTDLRPRFVVGNPAEASGIVDANVRRLSDRLDLTPEQEAAVRPLVRDWVERVQTLQQGTREELVDEVIRLETALSEMSPALTTAQQRQLMSLRRGLIVPAPARGRGRLSGPDGGRGGRSGAGREGQARPDGPGRE